MAGKYCADIVFCLDASGSMQPCIDGVRENVAKLVRDLQSDANAKWDVRFDYFAFHDGDDGLHWYHSVNYVSVPLFQALYHGEGKDRLFTRDLTEFCNSLRDNVEVEGEEMQLMALDTAMDFPWRDSGSCHRVVVLLSDEPVETGVLVERQIQAIPRLIEKIQSKRIKLFIFAPESGAFMKLASADKVEYDSDTVSGPGGFRNVNFSKLMETIAKSVSVTQYYDGGGTNPDPVFNQLELVPGEGEFHGA